MLGDPLHTLSFREIELLAALGAHTSLRGIARVHGVSAAAISRGVSAIERRFSAHILERCTQGVSLTERGRRMAHIAEEVLRDMRKLQEAACSPEGEVFVSYLGIGFSHGLCALLGGPVTAAVEQVLPGTGCRLYELASDHGAEGAKSGALDLMVAFGGADPNKQWTHHCIGMFPWTLCARPGHQIHNKNPNCSASDSLEQINENVTSGGSQFPLIQLAHVQYDNEESAHDWLAGFPLGSEVPDGLSALAVAAATDELACVPALLAREAILAGKVNVVETLVPPISSQLDVRANAENVPRKVFRAVCEVLARAAA